MIKLNVRALNDEGLKGFREYIKKTRESEKTTQTILLPYPAHMLNDEKYLTATKYGVQVNSNKRFTCRFEFGKYLVHQFSNAGVTVSSEDQGLWGWLALAYFQQLRNTKFRGKRGNKVATQRDEHFVPDEWNNNGSGQPVGYRHSVRSIFVLVRDFGDEAKFYASKSGMSGWGDVSEQMLSEKKVISSKGLRELIYDLYRDTDGYAKKGTGNKRPNQDYARTHKVGSSGGYGKLRRLTDDYLPRINLTYDVGGMNAEGLKTLIGDEFE